MWGYRCSIPRCLMEKETFFSGYCRCLDDSRMVSVFIEDGVLSEVDCSYENCPHTPNCIIAKSIQELLDQ